LHAQVSHFGNVKLKSDFRADREWSIGVDLYTRLVYVRRNTTVVRQLTRAQADGRSHPLGHSSAGPLYTGQGHLKDEGFDLFLTLFDESHPGEVIQVLIHLRDFKRNSGTVLTCQ
jgi:hypothetical protein